MTGNLRRSRDLALQYLELAERSSDVEARMIACRLVGTSLQATGRPREAAGYLPARSRCSTKTGTRR